MIKTCDITPTIYNSQSRDFQLLGRALEIIFNYSKTETDLLKECPMSDDSDDDMLPLLATTLGFRSKHKYVDRDLRAVLSSFSDMLKYKGSIQSVELAIRALLHAQRISDKFEVVSETDETNTSHYLCNYKIYISSDVTDLVLLEDLFDYILPAGFTYEFILTTFSEPYTSKIAVQQVQASASLKSKSIGQVSQPTGTNMAKLTTETLNSSSVASQISSAVVVGKDLNGTEE
jgi:hypothetical protein